MEVVYGSGPPLESQFTGRSSIERLNCLRIPAPVNHSIRLAVVYFYVQSLSPLKSILKENFARIHLYFKPPYLQGLETLSRKFHHDENITMRQEGDTSKLLQIDIGCVRPKLSKTIGVVELKGLVMPKFSIQWGCRINGVDKNPKNVDSSQSGPGDKCPITGDIESEKFHFIYNE